MCLEYKKVLLRAAVDFLQTEFHNCTVSRFLRYRHCLGAGVDQKNFSVVESKDSS